MNAILAAALLGQFVVTNGYPYPPKDSPLNRAIASVYVFGQNPGWPRIPPVQPRTIPIARKSIIGEVAQINEGPGILVLNLPVGRKTVRLTDQMEYRFPEGKFRRIQVGDIITIEGDTVVVMSGNTMPSVGERIPHVHP